MAFIPVPSVILVEMRYLIAGQRTENTLYFQDDTEDFEAATEALSSILVTQLWEGLRPVFTLGVTLREIYFTDLNTEDGPTFAVNDFLNPNGIVNTDALPNGTAMSICARTRGRGRSARGRNYIAGIAEGEMTSSVYSETAVSTVEDAYNDMRIAAQGAGYPNVVVSRYTNKLPRVEGISRPVSRWEVVSSGSKSQRRRNPGEGE